MAVPRFLNRGICFRSSQGYPTDNELWGEGLEARTEPSHASVANLRRHADYAGAILHVLFELRAECLQIRFQEPNITTHHAEVGNLLTLHPKIYRLSAHTEEVRGLFDGYWHFPIQSAGRLRKRELR